MLKRYIVRVHIDGTYTQEDPNCPSYWKGSGCYDITVNTWCDVDVEVWAQTEGDARNFALAYEYNDKDTDIEIEAVQVEWIKFVEDLVGRDMEETGVIEPVVYRWEENEKFW